MTLYLDVAAMRIQTWLGRSATLRGRRGASRMLADRTRQDVIKEWLVSRPDLDGVVWNDEGGDVDGVVTLCVTDTLERRVTEIAHAVLEHLRLGLPRVELNAVWAHGPSYVDAYQAMDYIVEAGEELLVDLAPSRGVPLARVCGDCGLDGVVREDYPIAGGDKTDVCADCEARYEGAGRTTGTKIEIIPGPEKDLAEWLEPEFRATGQTVEDIFRSFPDEFAKLATRATGPDGRPGTHTALVYADGNQIGAFIKDATAAGVTKDTLARSITEANRNAVVAAVLGVLDLDPTTHDVPVSPHLIAGDDLLVSLPATLVWPFLRAYLPTFEREMGTVGAGTVQLSPTASAGVVIAHGTYPFTDVMALAGTALNKAKREVRGARSSVCWLDVTADGPTVDSSRPVLATEAILDHEQKLHALAGTTSAGVRHTLRTAVREARCGTEPRVQPDELVRRLGADAVRPFLNNDELPLPVALDLIRWWR